MDVADTKLRYSLCRMNGDEIERIDHADDLGAIAQLINAGPREAWYMVAERGAQVRIADAEAQWAPSLNGYMVALFWWRRFEVAKGIARGNGRSLTGRYTPNVVMGHVNAVDAAQLQQRIDLFFDRLSAVNTPVGATCARCKKSAPGTGQYCESCQADYDFVDQIEAAEYERLARAGIYV